MNLGTTIDQIRKKRKLSQQYFAEKINKTQGFVSEIIHEKKAPSITTLREISKCLKVPLPLLIFLSFDDEDIKGQSKLIQDTCILLKDLIMKCIN